MSQTNLSKNIPSSGISNSKQIQVQRSNANIISNLLILNGQLNENSNKDNNNKDNEDKYGNNKENVKDKKFRSVTPVAPSKSNSNQSKNEKKKENKKDIDEQDPIPQYPTPTPYSQTPILPIRACSRENHDRRALNQNIVQKGKSNPPPTIQNLSMSISNINQINEYVKEKEYNSKDNQKITYRKKEKKEQVLINEEIDMDSASKHERRRSKGSQKDEDPEKEKGKA
ncbi:MAG: hypothetical protein EZS28_031018 [Streblomastix strix]|uniref:Uncharacterized protein n=1 Tax=Streblomastix strix TaxID=222440 RepID=A0A5J4UUN3_9EUKA|nr:MAG: hypothetical protein EZS28_031018 [Streblomastix strix]